MTKTKDFIISKLMIIGGCCCLGLAINIFIQPNNLALGGFSGIGLVLNYSVGIPVGLWVFVANIPLMFISWKVWDWKFMLNSLLGVVSSSLSIELIGHLSFLQMVVDDPLMPAIYGGILSGIGTGLVLRGGGTMGGNDILARLTEKYKGLPIGTFYLIFDGCVIAAVAFINGPTMALYSLIAVFVYSTVVNKVVDGLDSGKHTFIVSNNSQIIGDYINREMKRSFTYLHGRGGYAGQEFDVIMCVVNRWELFTLKKAVHELDPKAFLIVGDAHEVYGGGFREAISK